MNRQAMPVEKVDADARFQLAQSQTAGAMAEPQSSTISFGRDICGELDSADKREWLVTNGIGGFASGTLAGVQTRRYHGLLIAALNPPLGRTLLVSHVQEVAEYDGRRYELGSARWVGGIVAPAGFRLLESFRLEGTTPVWTFAVADALVEKRIWMEHGANTTYVSYRLLRGCRPLQLVAKALVNYRDYHASTHAGGWQMQVERVELGLRVQAFDGAAPFFLLSLNGDTEPAHEWYYNFDLSAERCRGLDDREDHLHVGTFRATLSLGKTFTIAASTEAAPDLDGDAAYRRQIANTEALLRRWVKVNPVAADQASDWIRQLVLAADQFIVRRPLADDPDGQSLIAGYHWFGDWGRDTMVALPGLTLATGRPEIAARILRTFASFVDQGMLPNVFPDAGQKPEYNTADAALWYFEAVRQYVAATNDLDFLRDLYPVLTDIIEWHLRGTGRATKSTPTLRMDCSTRASRACNSRGWTRK